MRRLLLRDGAVIPAPGRPAVRASVLIEDGRVAEIAAVDAQPERGATAPDAAIVDCDGAFLCAGFWNSHVHFFERKWADAATAPPADLDVQLAQFTRHGFTTVFDLSSQRSNTLALRRRIESGELAGPHILTTGEGIVAPGALPPPLVHALMGMMPVAMPEAIDADTAAAHAQALLQAGTDGVKVFASGQSGGVMPYEALRAIARVADAHRVPSFVHANTADDVLRALRARIGVVAHTTPRSPWDDEVLSAVAGSNAALTPTLHLWEFFARHDPVAVQQAIIDGALLQVRQWRDAGGTLLFGTDLGAVDADPEPEFALLARAGCTPADMLAMLTTAPAQRFSGRQSAGMLVAGEPADIVLLNRDPTQTHAALCDVRMTIRAGRAVYGCAAK